MTWRDFKIDIKIGNLKKILLYDTGKKLAVFYT